MEIELKYRVPDKTIFDKLLAQYAAPGPKTIAMHSCYYDTADGELHAHRAALRCRMENEEQVWTLKISQKKQDGITTRYEYDCHTTDKTQALASLIAQCQVEAVGEILQNSPLLPELELEFTRLETPVQVGQALLMLSYDWGQSEYQGKKKPISEIELELKQGTAEQLYAVARQIEATYGITPDTTGKHTYAKQV